MLKLCPPRLVAPPKDEVSSLAMNSLNSLGSYSRNHPCCCKPVDVRRAKMASKAPAKVSCSISSAVRINVSGTRYAVVRQAAELLNIEVNIDNDDSESDIIWIDGAVPLEKYMQLKPYQILNHFPGMGEICRKDSLARNIQKLRRVRRDEFNILPMTWILPSEFGALSHFIKELKRRRRSKTFIIKPPNGAMGNGISLASSIEGIPQGENLIVQEYIEKPLLLDGYKFDLRLYVLITSCHPLRIFMYRDGLVRLSTQLYIPPNNTNLDQLYMHLTNYSINKHSETFDKNEKFDKGSKRSLQYFNSWLLKNSYNIIELWAKIHDLVVKTLIVAQPHIQHSYQACRPGHMQLQDKCQCFEVLGFDVLIDENLRPWILEVNRSPSFGIETQLDVHIKTGVISDALKLLDIKPSDRVRKVNMQREASRRRLLQISNQSPRKQTLDIAGDQEEAMILLERRREEVKGKLSEIRKRKQLEEHEKECMGDYQRIYPSNDPQRQLIYENLIQDSMQIGFAGKSYQNRSLIRGLEKMKEKELLDLLSQYETEEKFSCVPTNVSWLHDAVPYTTGSLASFQPSIYYDSSPREVEMNVIAAREHEEEQTQRTMLALNTLRPSYPGKSGEDVKAIIEKIQSDWSNQYAKVGSFWLLTLDGTKRKQLLNPIRECARNLIKIHWRTTAIETTRLNKVFMRLFNYLLSNHGQGLWSTIPGDSEKEQWEKSFQKKYEILSMSELHCCRRLAELCQSTVIAAYYYHDFLTDKKKSSQIPVRRKSDIPLRPPSVYAVKRPSVVQLYGKSKSKSVPSVIISKVTRL